MARERANMYTEHNFSTRAVLEDVINRNSAVRRPVPLELETLEMPLVDRHPNFILKEGL